MMGSASELVQSLALASFRSRFLHVLDKQLGVKRSVQTDGCDVPIGVAIADANVHDQKLLADTLRSIPIKRPPPGSGKQHLCLDKGYHGKPAGRYVKRFSYIPHIRCRSEEQRRCRNGQRARRWVV